eukprot:1133013-Amphidinium_carterae.1
MVLAVYILEYLRLSSSQQVLTVLRFLDNLKCILVNGIVVHLIAYACHIFAPTLLIVHTGFIVRDWNGHLSHQVPSWHCGTGNIPGVTRTLSLQHYKPNEKYSRRNVSCCMRVNTFIIGLSCVG